MDMGMPMQYIYGKEEMKHLVMKHIVNIILLILNVQPKIIVKIIQVMNCVQQLDQHHG